jgi:hypothetical protein
VCAWSTAVSTVIKPAMRSLIQVVSHCTLAAALGLCGSAWAQAPGQDGTDAATASRQAAEIARGDPARWYVEDADYAARLRTLRKEIGAALQEARTLCKKGPAAERPECMKQAALTYQQDMAGAKDQAMRAR